MKNNYFKTVAFWLVILASMVLFRSLTWDIRPFPINAGVDDAKYAKDALEISNGNWLGAYDHLTLTKRPFFGLVQAARIHLGIPYTNFEFGFHMFCMLVFLWSLIKLGFNRYFSLGVYLVILFMPQFYDFQANRVSRDLFNNDLQIFIFAVSFVLAFAVDKILSTRARAFLWFLLCLLLSLHYGTREESFLIWPGLLILLTGHVWRYGPAPLGQKLRYGTALLVMFITVITTTKFLWQYKNYSEYGLFITIEHEQGSFARAIGALASIHEELVPSRLLIDQNERLKLAELSPTFAKIHFLLEDSTNDRSEGCQRKGVCEGYDYSHQIFAFRDSLPRMGVSKNAVAAENFYRQFANEIDGLCSTGALKCQLPLRATLLPNLSLEAAKRFFSVVAAHLGEIFTSSFVSYGLREDPFTVEDQVHFEKMTLQKVFLLKEKALVLGQLPASINVLESQISRRQTVAGFYKVFTMVLIASGVLILALGIYFKLFKNLWVVFILSSTMATILLRILAISFIGAVDSKMANAYVFPIYPMVIWFFLIAIYEVVRNYKSSLT